MAAYGKLSGVTRVEGVSTSEIRVECLDRETGTIVKTTLSGIGGYFEFTGLKVDGIYDIIARPFGKNAVISDSRKPIPYEPNLKWWRIRILEDSGWFSSIKSYQLQEFRFNDQQATGGTPFSKTSSENPPQFTLSNAFDGKTGLDQCWSSMDGLAGEYIGYQFASGIIVDSITLVARNHGNIAPVWTPKYFAVESSEDGIVYNEEWIVNSTAFAANESKTFTRP